MGEVIPLLDRVKDRGRQAASIQTAAERRDALARKAYLLSKDLDELPDMKAASEFLMLLAWDLITAPAPRTPEPAA